MILRLLMVGMVALTATGCMTVKRVNSDVSGAGWSKPGVSDSQRASEIRYCRRTADREAAMAHGVGYEDDYDQGRRSNTAYRQQQARYKATRTRQSMFAGCLKRYGYVYGRKNTSDQTQPQPQSKSQPQLQSQ